ncbi:PASTA domain-containing protein [Agromyces sp. NPDC056523]|uniref:PASTA domain-containing protein n=1 Tax=Agromyces sp. NPDC056523 TaxID=3345850 RepID=UPI00366AEC87
MPGTPVKAVATGFADCPIEGNDDTDPSEVDFAWFEQGTPSELATAEISSGTASTSFVVPLDSSPGVHTVVARCAGDVRMTTEASFEVTPSSVTTTVPDLIGLSIDEAAAELEEAQLVLGNVSGTGERVVSQVPPPGTDVVLQSAVDVDLNAPPTFTAVPDLVGLTLAEAQDALADAGLAAGIISGTGDRVGEQSLAPGTEVTAGTPVDLTMQAVPPRTVQVPDLVGMSTQDALAELGSLGLRLVVSSSSDGNTVASQDPAPGTAVPVGSDVTVVTTAAPSVSTEILILAVVLLVLAIVVAAAALARILYNSAQRAWVAKHVHVKLVTPVDVSSTIVAAPGEPDGTRHVVRIEPHPGERHHDLEEVRP